MITWDKNASWEAQFIVSHPHKAGLCVCVEQENTSCHQTKLISAESWNDPTWHLGSAEGRKVCQGRHPDAAWSDVQTVWSLPHWEFSRNKDMQSKNGPTWRIISGHFETENIRWDCGPWVKRPKQTKVCKSFFAPPLQNIGEDTHSTPGRYQRTAGQVRLAKGKVCLAVWCLVQKSCHGTTWLGGQKHSQFQDTWYCIYRKLILYIHISDI